jgi:A/G-specific adenine glycosylase
MGTDNFEENLKIHPLLREDSLTQFRKSLLYWGKLNFQVFPWRETHDPYAILIAEMMLHRTQVKQVLPIYNEFRKKFPDISSVHRDDGYAISISLKGLGLNWRAELFKKMADEICLKYQSVIPQEKALLKSLPGINEYIASAVRSFAWNYPEPIIDTNTVRITGRLFGLEIKDSSRRNSKFRLLLEKLIDQQHPANFNYALLDLAHLICYKKIKPNCGNCPINNYCDYARSIKLALKSENV